MDEAPETELVSIDDGGVDLEALQGRIRETVAEKRRRGVYTDEFLRLLEEPLDMEPDPTFVAGHAWPEALRSAEARVDVELDSRRRVLGPPVVFLKRAMRRALRWYLPPVVDQLNVHHRAVLEVLGEHNRQLSALQREAARLRQRLGEDPAPPDAGS